MNGPSRRIATALLLFPAALLVSVASGGLIPRVAAQSPAGVRIEPVGSSVDWSDGPFSVPIELSDLNHHGQIAYDDDRDTQADRFVPSEGLGGYELEFHVDPAVARVSRVEGGDFLDRAGRSTQCFQRTPEPGEYGLACVSVGSAPGPQGSGTLATITFEPVANGVSFLVLDAQLAGPLGDDVPIIVEGGIVEVFGGPDVPPTPRPGEDSSSSDGAPTVLDGGEPGDVTFPEGDPGPGATSLPRGTSPIVDGTTGADGASTSEGFPTAGIRRETQGTTVWPLALGGALAATGAALLLIGSRLGARARRP